MKILNSQFFPVAVLSLAFSPKVFLFLVIFQFKKFIVRMKMFIKLFLTFALSSLYIANSQAAIPYKVIFNDPKNSFSQEKKSILLNLDAAVKEWGKYIDSKGVLVIQVNVDSGDSGSVSAGATFEQFLGVRGGLNVYEGSGTYKLRTGKSTQPAKSDVTIEMNSEYVKSNHWIDPMPDTRTLPVPQGLADLVTVFAHELGHGFGMQGMLNTLTMEIAAHRSISLYDALFIDSIQRGQPVISGKMSKATYGDKVPVYFQKEYSTAVISTNGKIYDVVYEPGQNLYHYGRFQPGSSVENPKTFFGLMSGSWPWSQTEGLRIHVSLLDVAIMYDLGIPMVPGVFNKL